MIEVVDVAAKFDLFQDYEIGGPPKVYSLHNRCAIALVERRVCARP